MSVGTSIRCAECSAQEIEDGQQFCTNCGGPMVEVCDSCDIEIDDCTCDDKDKK